MEHCLEEGTAEKAQSEVHAPDEQERTLDLDPVAQSAGRGDNGGARVSRSERESLRQEIIVPGSLKWFERPFRVKSPSTGVILPEATGWAMDGAGRGPINIAGTYVGVALLVLARKDVGENGTTYGLSPNSLLTTVTAIFGVVAAISLPIVGAVVDHTNYRKTIAAGSAFLLIVCSYAQISINESNYLFILWMEALGGLVLLIHTAALYAYLPDLSANIEADYIQYTSAFNIRQYVFQSGCSMLTLLLVWLTAIEGDQVGNVQRNVRISSGLAAGWGTIAFGYSWKYLFRSRPATRETTEPLWRVGFTSVFSTARVVFQQYQALKWLMLALLFSPEQGAGVILSVLTTYLNVFLKLQSIPIGLLAFVLLVFNLPGSYLSRYASKRLNPLLSYQLAIGVCIITTILLPIVLNSPERKNVAYVFAAMLGTGLGWLYPSQRVLFCTLIPKGQEFEYMGLFAFFGNVLAWMIPLIATLLVNRNVDLRWTVGLLPIFFSVALILTKFMGSYDDAASFAKTQNGPATQTISNGENGWSLERIAQLDDEHQVKGKVEGN